MSESVSCGGQAHGIDDMFSVATTNPQDSVSKHVICQRTVSEMILPNARSMAFRTCHCVGTFLVAIAATSVSAADDKKSADQTRDEKLAIQRFELMKQRLLAAKATSDEPDFPQQFNSKPIFRYNDLARGHVSAAVWVLGGEGRPKALITSELDRFNHQRPVISYEYISMTKTPFVVRGDDIHWTPTGTLFEFKPIPDAPAPEATPQRRLIQIRDVAKRFASHETVGDEKCELRLLPQPVLRYTPTQQDRSDGAICFFTFGTNPEVILLIESDGKNWNYAAGRMTGAKEVVLTIDDTIAWQGPPPNYGLTSPSTGDNFPIDIPGIAKDGSEIKEE